MNRNTVITRHGSSVAENVWNVSCVVINIEENSKFVPAVQILSPAVIQWWVKILRIGSGYKGARSEIREWGRVLIKHVAICPPLSLSTLTAVPKPAISTKWSRPTINKPLEVFYSPTDLLEQNMNCARTLFTQLKRLYLRQRASSWTCLHFRTR